MKINNNAKMIEIFEYIKFIYKSKYLFKKLIIFFVVGIIVLTLSFVSRQLAIDSNNQYVNLIPGFINIKIVGNTGISFSILRGSNIHLILFVQSLPIIISLLVIAFSRNKLIDVCISFVFFGGLSNIIDRCIIDNYKFLSGIENINAVVDYLQFSFIKNSPIFNMPDVFIIVSTLVLIIYLFFSSFGIFSKRKDKLNEINNSHDKKEKVEK